MAHHHKNSTRIILIIFFVVFLTSCSENRSLQPSAVPDISPSPMTLSLPSGSGGGIIAFSSDRNRGQMDLFLINADGSELTQITHSSDDIIAPSWSPDGSYLAFLISKFNQLNLAILPIDSALINNSTDQILVLVEDPVEASPPSWSPDGSMIFYSASENENIDLYKIDLDGNNKVQLTESDDHEKHPAVSPDGSRLVYSSDQSGSFDLYIIDDINLTDLQYQPPIQLTFGEGDEVFPAWSPDGSRILFTSTENGNKDISYIDLSTGSVTQTKNSSADEWIASWSSNNTQFVYSYFNFDNSLNDIHVFDFEREDSIPITEDNFDNWWPAWKP